MEITKTDTLAFAYTVKLNRSLSESPTEADYKPFFDRLAKFSVQIEYKISEKDKRGHLHYHGIIYLKKGFFRRKLSLPGFHIKLEELYDKSGWVKYIHKDCQYHSLEQMARDSKLFK